MDTKKLRQKILDLAIHGKLVPQDPNDEPASVLLERIRAEKEQLIKEGKIKAPKKSKTAGDTSHYRKDWPFKVPEGWVWTTLDTIARFSGGKTPSMEDRSNWENGKHLWITSKDMKSEAICDSQIKLSDTGLQGMTIHHPGTILMVNRSGILRRTLPLAVLQKDATINQDLKAIIPYRFDSSPYLFYCLKAFEPIILQDYKKAGTTVDNINFDLFVTIPIPLPPIQEQGRIVQSIQSWMERIMTIEESNDEILDTIDSTKGKILELAIKGKLVPQDPSDEPAIELLKRINPSFKPSYNLHYKEHIPEGWCIAPISSFCTTVNGLWKGNKEPLINVGVIRNANFTKDFSLDYSKIEYIDVELKSFEKRNLEDGDIIVEKSGGSDNFPVGRSVLFNGESRKYSFSNFTMSLRIQDQNLIRPKYLYYVLQHKYRRGDMKQMQTQTTGLHNLQTDKFLAAPIPIPPIGEQDRIVLSIENLFRTIDGIRNMIKDGE